MGASKSKPAPAEVQQTYGPPPSTVRLAQASTSNIPTFNVKVTDVHHQTVEGTHSDHVVGSVQVHK